jgi:lysine 2,3-aminomutase
MLTQARKRKEISLWADVSDSQWNDWKWQVKNRISTLEELKSVFNLTEEEEYAIKRSKDIFRLGITPHYATLIDPDDPLCPMRLQAIPKRNEFEVADFEMTDPLHEELDSPVTGITHRYPDRVLFLITHECALFCRFCTRRRIVGDRQGTQTSMIDNAINYIRETPQIRDVLLSGGDPLEVSDARLEYVIANLRKIPHVEIIRIGSRNPVVMPQRITTELINMLKKYHPIWFNTHFNHPFELTQTATKRAMEMLIDAGIPTGNQTALLKGVNDCPVVIKKLMHELVKVRCRPYYLYNCDLSEGLSHFRTTVAKGIAILESLWGHTSGYAIPTFAIDAPGGKGKIPLLPKYQVSEFDGQIVLRNYKNQTALYHEGTPHNSFENGVCQTCGTDHSSIDVGLAKEIWQNKRKKI